HAEHVVHVVAERWLVRGAGLKAEAAPDPADRALRQADRLGERARRPRAAGPVLRERVRDHALDGLGGEARRRAGALLVLEPVEPLARDPAEPLAHGLLAEPRPRGDLLDVATVRGEQHGARAIGARLGAAIARPRLEDAALLGGHHERGHANTGRVTRAGVGS